MENRISKIDYYLGIAKEVAIRSTCLRRKYGAVIVNNDEVISTGYNGAARGMPNCNELGICLRNELDIPKGSHYELCTSVHAEANAIISAARKDMIGSTIYIVGLNADGSYADPRPCIMCARMILNAGIKYGYGMDINGNPMSIDVSVLGAEDIQVECLDTYIANKECDAKLKLEKMISKRKSFIGG